MRHDDAGRRQVAVIGAGIAGLGAAWSMARRHDVTLFEKNPYFGGHANTVNVGDDDVSPVDTGFIVYNEANYPHLVRLFAALNVPTVASDMSFAVSLDGGRLEYSGSGLRGLLAQPRNLVRRRFWEMLRDVRRFYSQAPRYLDSPLAARTIGELLTQERYSDAFVDDHLIPMAAAIWSASREDIAQYPVEAFIRFFDNHGLLTLQDRPQWRTVAGGSREYVRRLVADGGFTRAANRRIVRVLREPGSVRLIDADGRSSRFDAVVIATHANEALELLGDPSTTERSVLGAFRYSDNLACLHGDPALMPRRRAAWSSWNYLHERASSTAAPLTVSYWMNRLQPLAIDEDVFVTLNPVVPPAPALTYGTFRYEHPVFTIDTRLQQARSFVIQGAHNTWFCGSYLGHGFHEDALQSGLWVAEQLGAGHPWAEPVAFDRLPRSYQCAQPAAFALSA